MASISLEWFGATTYRLRTGGLTIFLDSWLERPSLLPRYISIDEVEEADYIFISHAHFDHLPGADRLALKTGAIVVANGEAINELRKAGVPDEQLLPVAGGERIPLFARSVRDAAVAGEVLTAHGPPGAPKRPHWSLTTISVQVWPSLHCLMPGNGPADLPDIMDTGTVYTGEAHPYVCTIDITVGMEHGLLKLDELIPERARDGGMVSFIEYVSDRKKNIFSAYDGGQLAFNLLISDKTLFWSAHLGAYETILKNMQPKPDIAILAIAGRANMNGRPYDGSAAEFMLNQVRWLDEPKYLIWCLHDESVVKPWRCDTKAADDLIGKATSSQILHLPQGEVFTLEL